MKEIPILFSTAMVQAILEGRKSQTRRLLKLKHLPLSDIESVHPDGSGKGWIAWAGRAVSAEETTIVYPGEQGFKCPYGKPGDVLWVRETFTVLEPEHCIDMDKRFAYKASCCAESEEIRKEYVECGWPYTWKPSIHMPKEAARIWLQVENVRVERLQDISEEDAKAEGVEKIGDSVFCWKHYSGQNAGCSDAKTSFQSLWQNINGDDSWQSNPWVWVVSFKVLSTIGKPVEKSAITNI